MVARVERAALAYEADGISRTSPSSVTTEHRPRGTNGGCPFRVAFSGQSARLMARPLVGVTQSNRKRAGAFPLPRSQRTGGCVDDCGSHIKQCFLKQLSRFQTHYAALTDVIRNHQV